MKTSSDELIRLKKVLLTDSLRIPNGVIEVLKSDVAVVLNSYFEIKKDDVIAAVSVDENGEYHVEITAACSGIKKVKSI